MKFSLRRYSSGTAYTYFSQLTPLLMIGFFRKIHVNNRKGIPPGKPVLLASNHPTAFVDPFLLGTFADPPLYNMTRGDLFKKPIFRKILESYNMFPIFRARDGYVEQDRNDPIIEYCVGQLQQKKIVTIYVEGEHHLDKRLKPVQKGIARIAFAAYERHSDPELQVIPAACNYRRGDAPRDDAMVNVGSPIYIRDYWEEYRQAPAKAILRLCRDVENALKPLCFHIQNPEDDALGEQLLTLHRSEHPDPGLPPLCYETNRFADEKSVLDALNHLDPVEKEALRLRAGEYFGQLAEAGLDDAALSNPQRADLNAFMLFVPGFLPFVVGYLSAWPLATLAENVARSKVKKREFLTSVWMGVGFIGGILYYFGLLLAALVSARPVWVATALLLPLLGWFSRYYIERWVSWSAAFKAKKHPKRAALLEKRARLKLVSRDLELNYDYA
jgi:glycerol-3-phosphate O-acyltransferase / dihydroxyacetone phosphate acyltransferase